MWRLDQHCNNTIITEKNLAADVFYTVDDIQSDNLPPYVQVFILFNEDVFSSGSNRLLAKQHNVEENEQNTSCW